LIVLTALGLTAFKPSVLEGCSFLLSVCAERFTDMFCSFAVLLFYRF
jgi:hypothetical protein